MGERFCNRDGIKCPYNTTEAQVRYCASWDPLDFMCNDTCRHLRIVDNLEQPARHRQERIEAIKKQAERSKQAQPMQLNKAETPEEQTKRRKEEATKDRTEALRQISAELAKLYEEVREVADILRKQEEKTARSNIKPNGEANWIIYCDGREDHDEEYDEKENREDAADE